jgi:hypothetical protein
LILSETTNPKSEIIKSNLNPPFIPQTKIRCLTANIKFGFTRKRHTFTIERHGFTAERRTFTREKHRFTSENYTFTRKIVPIENG